MGAELHWFPEDVALSRLASVLVGMANTTGGTVLLGISPRSGQVQGVSSPAEAVDRVFQAALLSDPPLVLPVPSVHPVGASGVKVIWITVPAGLPNVYSLDGSYLGREDRQTNPLSARRLRQLLIERGVIQLEARVPPGATLADLDQDQVIDYARLLQSRAAAGVGDSPQPIEDFKIACETVLLRRGCVQRVDGELHPTYAALLLFGRFPQQWLPNATILSARFSGESFADQFIKQDLAGTLPEQLRQAEAFVRENLRSVIRMVGMAHQETLEYPFEAVRELLVNAVAHRDYNIQGDNIHLNIFSDRLEVSSPGGLPGPVNLKNLLEARFSRNAVLVQVLSDMGYVERLGYGLDRVVAVLKQSNMRAPRFEEVSGCFKVSLYAAEEAMPLSDALPAGLPQRFFAYQDLDLNPRQQAALAYVGQNKRITNSAYQDLCPDVHAETLRRDLVDLVARGILIKIGDKRSTYYILKKS